MTISNRKVNESGTYNAPGTGELIDVWPGQLDLYAMGSGTADFVSGSIVFEFTPDGTNYVPLLSTATHIRESVELAAPGQVRTRCTAIAPGPLNWAVRQGA